MYKKTKTKKENKMNGNSNDMKWRETMISVVNALADLDYNLGDDLSAGYYDGLDEEVA